MQNIADWKKKIIFSTVNLMQSEVKKKTRNEEAFFVNELYGT